MCGHRQHSERQKHCPAILQHIPWLLQFEAVLVERALQQVSLLPFSGMMMTSGFQSNDLLCVRGKKERKEGRKREKERKKSLNIEFELPFI